MMQNAVITIKGTQTADGDSDTVELVTRGRFGRRDGDWLLCYEENESSGMNGVQTQIHVRQDGTVTVKRSGAAESRLVIAKGQKNICFYPAPQGSLALEVFGESVENGLTETGGRLFVRYTLSSEGRQISWNTVEIRAVRQEEP